MLHVLHLCYYPHTLRDSVQCLPYAVYFGVYLSCCLISQFQWTTAGWWPRYGSARAGVSPVLWTGQSSTATLVCTVSLSCTVTLVCAVSLLCLISLVCTVTLACTVSQVCTVHQAYRLQPACARNLMEIPGLDSVKTHFNLFPGTRDSCADLLRSVCTLGCLVIVWFIVDLVFFYLVLS